MLFYLHIAHKKHRKALGLSYMTFRIHEFGVPHWRDNKYFRAQKRRLLIDLLAVWNTCVLHDIKNVAFIRIPKNLPMIRRWSEDVMPCTISFWLNSVLLSWNMELHVVLALFSLVTCVELPKRSKHSSIPNRHVWWVFSAGTSISYIFFFYLFSSLEMYLDTECWLCT